MASASSLEEEITCSVCYDIYNDPHALIRCLHTYCLKCIKKLEEDGQVQCPDCRTVTKMTDIKKDFKMQRLIDIHNLGQTGSSMMTTEEDKCGLCQKESVLITHHCTDCEIFLCAGCSKRHQTNKALKSHTLMSASNLSKAVGPKLKENIRRLENQVTNIDISIKNVLQNVVDVEKEKTRQIAEVKKLTMDAIQDMKTNQKRLEVIVTDSNQTLINHLHQNKIILEQQKRELLTNIASLKSLTKSQDIKTLQQNTKTLNETIKKDIIKTKEIIESKSVNLKSPISVQKSKNWDVKDSIEVSVDNIPTSSQQIGPVLKKLYSALHTKTFTLTDNTDLNFFPFGLSMINNQLWCPGSNSCVNVFDQSCQLVKQIEHEQIPSPESVTTCDNEHVIVACSDNKGLHLLQSNGEYRSKIMDGNFADVACYDGRLFALEYETCKIIVLRKDDNMWNEVNSYQLQHSHGDIWDRLCVHANGIYVSSFNHDCIYVYDKHGQLQFTRGETGSESAGELNNPFLCSVDSDGNMLVADRWNNRLQVCDSSGQWRVVQLPTEVKFPRDVVVGDGGEMWIASSGLPTKLEKYMKVSPPKPASPSKPELVFEVLPPKAKHSAPSSFSLERFF